MYRLLRLFSKVRAHSRRCSSFPTATRRASVSDIAATRWSLTDVACPLRVLCWARSWRAALRAAFTLGLYLFRQRMAKRKIRREVCLSFWVLAAEGVLHSFDFKCSGEMNSPCAEVLPAAKRSYGANAPPRRAGPHPVMYLFRQHMTRRRGLHIVRNDFFTTVISHSFRRSSSPDRTHYAGLRLGFGNKPEAAACPENTMQRAS